MERISTTLRVGYFLIILALGCSPDNGHPVHHWLAGSWTAPAFDGALHETWEQIGDGMFVKEGYYIEHGDTLYSEEVRIDSLFGGVYLIAQPRGGNPVIFRMTEQDAATMTFENQGNRNPYRIVYERTDNDHFVRTTFGIEAEDSVSNRFAFTRSTP